MKSRDFFLTSVQGDHPGLGIAEDTRKTAVGPEAREGVETCESGFGFHNSQTLPLSPKPVKFSKNVFPMKRAKNDPQ